MPDFPPLNTSTAIPGSPPALFRETLTIPEAAYRTAVAIQNRGRMKSVEVVFVLQTHDARSAQYQAICPRCHAGDIVVTVKLTQNGQFQAPPACPALCLSCEDKLDSMLESGSSSRTPSDRAALNATLKIMTSRPFD